MAALGDLIGRVLYPKDAVCIACGTLRVDDAAAHLCAACAKALSPLTGPFCPRCGAPGWMMECGECAVKPPGPLAWSRAAFAYDGTPKALVRALKYHCIQSAADALAAAMALILPEEARFDALVPVPLHPRRQRSRGFNQAEALSNALGAATGIPVRADLLTRARATRTQTRLSPDRRQQNVSGAFASDARATGLRLLLVDDVLTTGATASACAKALREGGAAYVAMVAAARAATDTDA